MGGIHSSRSMESNQNTLNQINNVSNQNCITACTTNLTNTTMHLEHSTVNGNINITSACTITGSSCMLKASMTNDLHNTQKSTEEMKKIEEDDPLNILPMGLLGDSSSDSQKSNQDITNRVSNVMNATCQNKTTSNVSGTTITLDDSTVNGNININAHGDIDNAQCILNNVATNQITNSQTSKMKNKVFQGSPVLFIIVAIVIVAVVGMIAFLLFGVGGLVVYSKHHKALNPGAINPATGLPMTPPTINPATGLPMAPPTINPATGLPMTPPTINPATGLPMTPPTINPATVPPVTVPPIARPPIARPPIARPVVKRPQVARPVVKR